MNGTANNLATLFNGLSAIANKCVLFLDEMDSIASKRSNGDTARQSQNTATNSLLVRLERHRGLVIAATNRASSIDPAVWRRFDLHLDIELPGDEERFAILRRYLAPYHLPDASIDMLVDATTGAAPSLLRQIMEGIKRDLVLSPRLSRSTTASDVFERIRASIQAHPDYTPPPLWTDFNMRQRITNLIDWPPMIPAEPDDREDAA